MKIEKKLWITLFVFGLFAIGFSGWIFSQSTAREKLLWDNTIRFETKKLTDGEIKSENIALPEDFDDPRSILFKTTHTIAEVWLDGEKIYEAIEKNLKRANVAPQVKKDKLLSQFLVIKDTKAINEVNEYLKKTPLKHYTEFLYENIYKNIKYIHLLWGFLLGICL